MESKAISRTRLLIPAALLVGASGLSIMVSVGPVMPGDRVILEAVRSAELPLLDLLCQSLDFLGDRWMIIASILALSVVLWVRGRRAEALACLLIIPLELMTLGLREVIDRPRPIPPFFPRSDVMTGSPGFPSGTTLHALLFFGFITYIVHVCVRRVKLRLALQGALVAVIVVISYSRVYVGAHWPSDILGAWLYGGLFLWFIVAVGLPAIGRLRCESPPSLRQAKGRPNLPP